MSKILMYQSSKSQRKDGRYAYKYTDTFEKPQFVYAWKLVPTDKPLRVGVRINPFDFHINTVIEDDTEPKVPLSPTQEESRNFSDWRLKGKERFYYFFTTFQSQNTSRFKKMCEYLPIHKMPKMPETTGYTGI